MTLEETISAVREIIEEQRVEVHNELQNLCEEHTWKTEQRYGYFNGKKVRDSVHSMRVKIRRISHADQHFILHFSHQGQTDTLLIRPDDIDEFCERLVSIQDVAEL